MVSVDEIAPGIQGIDINVEVYYDVDSDVKKKRPSHHTFFF